MMHSAEKKVTGTPYIHIVYLTILADKNMDSIVNSSLLSFMTFLSTFFLHSFAHSVLLHS